MKALSLWQPWAWLVIHGGKDVENRSWSTLYRGPLLIHAGKRKLPLDELRYILDGLEDAGLADVATKLHGALTVSELPTGGIVGQVDVVACVKRSVSLWAADDQWNWKLANPRSLPFMAMRGARGLFEVTMQQLASAPRTL